MAAETSSSLGGVMGAGFGPVVASFDTCKAVVLCAAGSSATAAELSSATAVAANNDASATIAKPSKCASRTMLQFLPVAIRSPALLFLGFLFFFLVFIFERDDVAWLEAFEDFHVVAARLAELDVAPFGFRFGVFRIDEPDILLLFLFLVGLDRLLGHDQGVRLVVGGDLHLAAHAG